MAYASLKFSKPYRQWKAGEVVPIYSSRQRSDLKPGVAKFLVDRGFAEYADAPKKSKPAPRKRASKRATDDSAGESTSTDQHPASGE